MRPSDLLARFRRASLRPGPPLPETAEEAERERILHLTSSELWIEYATALLGAMGLPNDLMSVHERTDDLHLVMNDAAFWIGWAEAREHLGDTERASIFRDLAASAEERRELLDWRETMAKGLEAEDPARAARLRAMGAAERKKEASALQAARERLSPTGQPGPARLAPVIVDDRDDDAEADDGL